MSTSPAEVRVRAWTWKSHDTPRTVPGLRLYNANGRGVFIPYADAHKTADMIVDYAEQHESKENN